MNIKTKTKILKLWHQGRNVWEISRLTGEKEAVVSDVVMGRVKLWRVTLSDRKNRRTVEADSSANAVRAVVGARIYSLQEESYYTSGGGVWRVNTAVAKPTGGFTPVREIRAYVEALAD